jgi:ferrous iron transport protein A
MTCLLDINPGASARVIDFQGGIGLRKKLTQYGIQPGDCLRMIRRAPLGGPLLIVCNQREIALGRGVAKQILVEMAPCESL